MKTKETSIRGSTTALAEADKKKKVPVSGLSVSQVRQLNRALLISQGKPFGLALTLTRDLLFYLEEGGIFHR